MANYLLSIVAASIFVAVLCAAAPEEEGIGKFVGFAGALIVALIALSPLTGGIEEWMDGLETQWNMDEQQSPAEMQAQSAQYLAYNIALTMSELYTLEMEDISVTVYPKDNLESFAAEKVCVTLPASTKIDTEKASDTLSKLFSCTVMVQNE
ncbi:MAG: hypothetical protein HFE66_06525 [Clostridiales bacterium]|jgi:hypothetical protein|nr:hypothetical protein [Clostridiales bacterium]